MEWFLIYLFVMIERVGALLMFGWAAFWIGLALLVVTFVSCAATSTDYGESRSLSEIWQDKTATILKRTTKWMIGVGFIVGILGFLMPTQKDAAIIIGSGVTYNVLTSETGKRLGGKAVELLEQKIDSALNSKEETKPADPIKGKAL